MHITPEQITELLLEYGPKVLAAALILVLGYLGAKLVRSLLRRGMRRAKLDPALVGFLGTLAYALLLAFVIIAALSKLGVNTTSFAAVVAAAGLAVGLALQGSLSNFAAGVMLIGNRPFSIGDRVEAAGVDGKVETITIFTTRMRTPDNRVIIVPNSKILGDVIVNHSAEATRRIDMVVGIGYDDDIETARRVLLEVMTAHPEVLAEPAPVVLVGELADSSVNLLVRPWVKTEVYAATMVELMEGFKGALDAAGITIPYPQQEVHMRQVA